MCCRVLCRFMPAPTPTSGAALSDAGLLQADAVLLAAEEGLRSSPAEADAAVLSCLVSIQHLLASKGVSRALSHSRSLAGKFDLRALNAMPVMLQVKWCWPALQDALTMNPA